MNNSREKFELKISMEYEQPPCLDRDGDGYDDSYVDNAWWGWQAATEQSQKEIADLQGDIKRRRRFFNSYVEIANKNANTIVELQAREKVLVELAKLTYGYLWHINAGLDAPAILNVTSITPEKCSHIVRKLWLDVLTKEQRGEGINKALEALANVRGE